MSYPGRLPSILLPLSATAIVSIAVTGTALARQPGFTTFHNGVSSRSALTSSTPSSFQERTVEGIGLLWRQPTNLPEGRTRPAVAVGHDGRIYVFGGSGPTESSPATGSTFIYDPRRNTWQSGLSMPTPREGAQAVTLPDGRIAVLGGGTGCSTNICESGTVYNSVEVYIPSQNAWTALPPMETPRYRFAAVLGPGGRIYAIGGSDGHSATATAEAYNPRTGRWSYIVSLPRPEESAGAVVATSGKIYVTGGLENDGHTIDNSVFVWNGTYWQSGVPMPQATQDHATTLGADGDIYVIGGWNQTALATVQKYDPGNAAWSFEASLFSGEFGSAAVMLPDGDIYCIGGNTGSSPSAQVSVYGPSISLASSSVRSGANATVRGDGFATNALVHIYWGGSKASSLLGIGHTDDTGTLVRPIRITIPKHLHPGHYRIVAVDNRSHYPTNQIVTVPRHS